MDKEQHKCCKLGSFLQKLLYSAISIMQSSCDSTAEHIYKTKGKRLWGERASLCDPHSPSFSSVCKGLMGEQERRKLPQGWHCPNPQHSTEQAVQGWAAGSVFLEPLYIQWRLHEGTAGLYNLFPLLLRGDWPCPAPSFRSKPCALLHTLG